MGRGWCSGRRMSQRRMPFPVEYGKRRDMLTLEVALPLSLSCRPVDGRGLAPISTLFDTRSIMSSGRVMGWYLVLPCADEAAGVMPVMSCDGPRVLLDATVSP